jgi:signal transduction histidine kinase
MLAGFGGFVLLAIELIRHGIPQSQWDWLFEVSKTVAVYLGLAIITYLFMALRATKRALFRLRVHDLQVDQLVALGRLVSSIAHEVRNPLHNLGLLLKDLDTLCKIDESGQSSQVIERIQVNCARIDYAVTLVYRLARPGDLEHRLSEVTAYPIHELVDDIEQQLTPAMQERVRTTINLSSQVKISYPKEFMVIIVDNLLRNACEASAKTPVYFDITSEQRAVLVSVHNEGKISKRAMEELTLEEIPTQRVSGLGLGVFIIRHLASQMNLKVDYVCSNSVVTATLRIPIHYTFGML